MGIARLEIKKAAAYSVPGYFGLYTKTSTDEINALIIDDTYIYPRQVCVGLRFAATLY